MDANYLNELLDNAEEALTDAIGFLEEFAGATGNRAMSHYIIAHLKGWRDGDNPHDATAIPRLREELEKPDAPAARKEGR